MMKHAFVLALLLLGLSITGYAQRSHEQIAGQWIVNAKQTDRSAVVAGMIWTIPVDGDAVNIRRSSLSGDVDTKLLATGKSESGDIRSTTKWDGSSLIRIFSMTLPVNKGYITAKNIESYRLSADGESLIYERSVKPDGGSPEPILVHRIIFDRKH